MATLDGPEKNGRAPQVPYISFRTLLNMAERLEPEPPPRIDRSVLSYLSGGYRSQLLTTLRNLDLTDDAGAPTQDLIRLVTVPDGRKQMIRRIWERTYADVFHSFDLSKGTTDQLSEAFSRYAVAGETKSKAMIFFVHGARFAEIPLSTRIIAGVSRAKLSTGPRVSGRPRAPSGHAQAKNGQVPSPQKLSEVAVSVHPMLSGAIQWLAENADNWTAEQAEAWCQGFVSIVRLVYPPAKKPRLKEVVPDAAPTQA
jgi:hypothetical protein